MVVIQECGECIERMEAYVGGQLPQDEHLAVDDHMRTCPDCREGVEQFIQVSGLLEGTLGQEPLRNDFHEQTGQKLKAITTGEAQLPSAQFIGEGYEEEAEGYDEEFDEDTGPRVSIFDILRKRFGAVPWWTISGAFHALLIMLVTLIGMAILRSNNTDSVIVTDLRKSVDLDDHEELKERDVFKKPQPVENVEFTEETTMFTHEEVEVADVVETDDDSDAQDTFGEEGISDCFLGGSGTVAAIGMGGGSAGAFGRPTGAGGRLRRAIRGGGGRDTESAVDKGLEWLARNQEPEGHWDNAKHGGKHKGITGDSAMTGFALLAFLGAGHTEKVGKYKDNVRRAVKWLKDNQGKNRAGHKGRWTRNNYANGIATMGLCEAAGMGRILDTMKAAQLASDGVDYGQIQGENDSDRWAWDYGPRGKNNDASIMAWNVMALKSAKVAGMQVNPSCFEGALRWVNAGQDLGGLNPNDPVPDSDWAGGRMKYRGPCMENQPKGKGSYRVMAAASLCRLHIGGAGLDTPGVLGPCNILKQKLIPKKWPYDMYLGYYATLTMFQKGGDYWKAWNDGMKKTLLAGQVKGGANDGSWDPEGTRSDNSRVMSTALCVMCLEVYYRYMPLYRGK